jgi:hypothetical protein
MAHRLRTAPATATAIPFPRARERFHALADEMPERERWPREQIRRYQAARLRRCTSRTGSSRSSARGARTCRASR